MNRYTFCGQKIKYTELTQQHLSNIIWFNRIFHPEYHNQYEILTLNLRYNGVLLLYRPSYAFVNEIVGLRQRCLLQNDGRIILNKKEIGYIMNELKYNDYPNETK